MNVNKQKDFYMAQLDISENRRHLIMVKNAEPWAYAGNPARFIKKRLIKN